MFPQRWWIGVLVYAGMLLAAFAQPAEAVILINEILADPAGDANGDGSTHTTRDEFVELVNTSLAQISLASWTLSDGVQVRHTFDLASAIPAGSFFVVFGGGVPQGFTHAVVASAGGLGLNNAGDTVSLRDANGNLIDQFIYGSEANHDASLTRFPDAGSGPFMAHNAINALSFSPELTVEGLSSLPQAAPDTVPDELPPHPTVPEPSSCWLVLMGAAAQLNRTIRHTIRVRTCT